MDASASNPSPLEGEGGAHAERRGRVRGKPRYSKETLERAKTLRREMTPQERQLWGALRDRRLAGFKFRAQQPIGPFIADFVCQSEKLIIEADGSQHADSAADASRDAYLRSKGYRVIRFWNNEITREFAAVLETIYATLKPPHPPTAARRAPPSPSRGEGLGDRHA